MPAAPDKPARSEFWRFGRRERILVGRLLLLIVVCIPICLIICGLLQPSAGRHVPERDVKQAFAFAFLGIALACVSHAIMRRPPQQIPDVPTRRRWPWAAVLMLFVVLVVTYPLSYAPVVRIQSAASGKSGKRIDFYRPVDWLIDNTPLQEPLFFWAKVWGVERVFIVQAIDRKYGDAR